MTSGPPVCCTRIAFMVVLYERNLTTVVILSGAGWFAKRSNREVEGPRVRQQRVNLEKRSHDRARELPD